MKKVYKSRIFLCLLAFMLIVGASVFSYAEGEQVEGEENPTTEEATGETTEEPTEENPEETLGDGSVSVKSSGNTITITKKWNDGLKGSKANNRQPPEVVIRGELLRDGLLDFYYPVGSYYETSSSTVDPNVDFVGVWVLETEGVVHVSGGDTYTVANANESGGQGLLDGGEKDAQIVNHQHSIPAVSGSASSAGGHSHRMDYSKSAASGSSTGGAGSGGTRHTSYNNGGGHSATFPAGTSGEAGEDGTDANMQPYVNVYRWHRVS